MALEQSIIDALPENYREHQIVKEATDVASVVKMAIDGQAELGHRIRVPSADADAETRQAFRQDLLTKVPDLVLVPGEGATDDERASFYKSLGRPDEAGHYKTDNVKMPEGVPEDFKIPAAQLEAMQKLAFENNLSQAQFEGVVTNWLGRAAEALTADQAALDERNAKLKEQFGSAEEAKRNAAVRAAEKHGLTEADLTTPELWAAFAQIGESYIEAGTMGTGAHNAPLAGLLTPADAKAKMDEIRSNPDHAYHKRTRPGHETAVFEMFNLNLQASGQKPLTRAEYDAMYGRQGSVNSSQFQTRGAQVG